MNRRDAVASLAAGAALTMLGGAGGVTGAEPGGQGEGPARGRLFLGIQFFTIVGNGATIGWPMYSEMLGRVRGVGYDGVELAGFSGYAPDMIRRRAESLGLKIPSVHIGFDQVFAWLPPRPWGPDTFSQAQDVVYSPPAVEQLARLLAGPTRDVGAQFAVIAGGGRVNFLTRDSTLRFADALNKASATVQQKGLKLSWHPHAPEWTPFKAGPDAGKAPFELIVAHTDPAIRYELDIYWSALGSGQMPQDTIRQFASRLALFHLKDKSRDGKIATPGEGTFDFAAIHRAIERDITPPRFCYVERDGANTDHPIETAQKAWQYLYKLGFGQRAAGPSANAA